MATIAERKKNAVGLLDTHADAYRILYTKLANAKKITDEAEQQAALLTVNREMAMLETEATIIHKQLQYLTELETYEMRLVQPS